VAELEGTTAEAMWLRDLEEFSAVWAKMRGERETALANGGKRKKGAAGGPGKPKTFKIRPKAVKA
jgi:hypothetical protein